MRKDNNGIQQVFVSVLIVSFVFAPIAPAFAQSADVGSDTQATASSDTSQSATDNSTILPPAAPETAPAPGTVTTPDNAPAPDTSLPTSPAPADSLGAPAAGADQSAAVATPPTINATQNAAPVGGMDNPQTAPDLQPVVYGSFSQDQVKIDKNTGALNTTYPIAIPPGRNNLQPNLDLVYNSQNNQQGSIFGEGWSIGIPYIERLNIYGVDNLYSTSTPNLFSSSLDGELASTTASSSYIARTEDGTFNKYTFVNNVWTMTDKNGTQFIFGSSTQSRQNDPNNASDTYRWMLEQVVDTNNNNIAYSYFKDSGQIYPSSTVYTGNGSSTGIFEVDFQVASSTDNTTSSATGFAVKPNYRVSEIDALANGTWVRKYVLGYTTGDNGYTTLLGSITESGQNSSGTVVSLPSPHFSYQTQTPGWTSSSTWNPPTPFVGNLGTDNGVRAVDVNGDGLSDIVSSSAAWVNTGGGWTSSSTWNSPAAFSVAGTDNGVRAVDVNGDGLTDIISGSGAWINNGHGWTSSSTWTSPVSFVSNSASNGTIIVDANGDGLPDIIQGYTNASGTAQYAAYINTGSGWATSTAWNPPIPFVANGGLDNGTRIVDLNGDGLPDIVQGYTDASGTLQSVVYINTGTGWATSTIWNTPVAFMTNGGWDNGVRFADVNGDGLPDIIQSYTDVSGNPHYAAYINTGHGWTSDSAWIPPTVFDQNGGYDQGARIVDVGGSGLPDVFSGYVNVSGTAQYAAWVNNNNNRADLLTTIFYPQGGNSTIQYKSASQFMSSGNIANHAPYPVYVASQITANDGSGNSSFSAYQYSGGTYYYGDPHDHKFAGFSLVTQTNAAGNVTKTYYHTGNGADSANGEYADNFWKIGKPYRAENYDNAGHLYKAVITKWDSTSTVGNAAFVFPDQTVELDYDGLVTHQDSAESYTWNNANGNETQKIQWGQVTGNNDGTFTDTGSDELIKNSTYASSTTSNVTGKVSDETLTNQSSTKIQETEYYYDGLSLSGVGAGNLTKQQDWKSGSTYVNTVQNTYNSYGLVTQKLDANNNTSTYSYDSYNLYPATTTNALGQSSEYQYDYSTGKPTQTIDPNNLVFQTVYDGLGRTLQVMQPDQVVTSTLDLKTAYTYVDTLNAVSVEESDYMSTSTSVGTYSYYDGLNRLIQTRKSTNSGTYKATDRAYNNVDLLQEESLPYFSDGYSKTAPTSSAALFASYTYDPLGRVLTTVNAVGTVSNVYTNWKTTVTDANGNPKDEYHDAYGNLSQVGEHNASNTYTTTYSYDGLNDLLNLTDANGSVRNFTYDGLGRLVSSTDLHATADNTYGTWSYTYDDVGNLTSRVDPKNQTVNYTYDNVNRVLTETLGGQGEITYVYDTCTNGVGRLCSASSTDALVAKIYDPFGNLANETKTIGGTGYTTAYTYDRQGNVLTITNPDNSVIQYSYGAGGLITKVQEKESGGSFSDVVSSFDYSPMDKVTKQVNANGVTTVNVYDPTRLYRLHHTITTTGGSDHMMSSGGGLGMQGMGVSTTTVTESCTGELTSYAVPSGVTKLYITAYGAQGGGAWGKNGGGSGGKVAGTLTVTSGTTYYINVGCQNGYNGGGGWGGSYYGQTYAGGSGGGMTWISANSIFTTSTVLMVAGGGGGQGGSGSNGDGSIGGGGGGLNGNNGTSWGGIGPGGGGTQNAGGSGGSPAGGNSFIGTAGSAGQSGFGGESVYQSGGGGGGGAGYYGGGGGAAAGYNGGGNPGAGGGGGSSYIAATPYLTSTSTVSGVNSGDGYLTITPVLPISLPGQYYLDGVTPLGAGAYSNQGGVVLGATLDSGASTTLQLQVEVEAAGVNFTNVPNVTSSISVSRGTVATTTFTGVNGIYHWQARAIDAQNNTSTWQMFGPSATSTDFILATFVTKSYTGSVTSFTVPAHVTKLSITAYGAHGSSSGGYGTAGGGAQVAGMLSVTSSQVLYISVGGHNGYGGGGSGGSSGTGTSGSVGGGMTWVGSASTYSNATAYIVAGGGGGAGGDGYGNGHPSGGGSGSGGGAGTGTTGGSGGYNGYWNNGGQSGSAAQGGNGTSGYYSSDGGGGGGGGGYWGAGGGQGGTGEVALGGGGGLAPASSTGGNGSSGWYNSYYGTGGGGGGGGGSSFVSSTLSSTTPMTGDGSSDGSVVILEILDPVPTISSSSQYRSDGVTPLNQGSSTNKNSVAFNAALNSYSAPSLQLQVEVEPTGTAFTNIPNVTSTFVSPGQTSTATFAGANGGYHWQARAIDNASNTSAWQAGFPSPNPGTPSSLAQYKSDGATSIGQGSSTTESTVFFKAFLNTSSSNNLQLQVQISTSTSFTNVLNSTSTAVAPGNYVMTTIPVIPNSSYYWQARTIDTVTNVSSSWVQFGAGAVGFVVSAASSTTNYVEISDGSVKALYHLEGTSDSSGNSYTLTNNGSVQFNAGKLNNAADFGSSNSTKYLKNGSSLGINGGSISLSAWFNATTAPTGQSGIVIESDATNRVTYSIVYDGSSGKTIYCDRNKQYVGEDRANYTHDFGTGSWHHVACTYDGSSLLLSVDGIQQGSASSTGNGSSGGYSCIGVGAAGSAGAGCDGGLFSGLVDEAVIANSKLSSSTISALYNNGIGKEVCVTSGCGGSGGSSSTPTVSSLAQYKSDGTTSIGQGSSTTESTVVLHALLNSSSSNNLQLQVQVSTSTSFTNPLIGISAPVGPGHYATTTVSYLSNASYYWQARAIDTVTGIASLLQAFGTSTADFITTSSGTSATGGTITYAGGKTIHTFNASGTFTVPSSLTNVSVLLVGGGGGASTAGGGGGGVVRDDSHTVTAQSYPIVVGSGGPGHLAAGNGAAGTSGTTSTFDNLSAQGGGAGGHNDATGINGGSGGGAGAASTGPYNGGTGSQGGNGGNGANNWDGTAGSAAGGGGGGQNGFTPSDNHHGGNGGNGTSSSITGSSVTYAGGGGGGFFSSNDGVLVAGGSGGTGGGGNGVINSNGQNGTDNLGGGGGASNAWHYNSGNGGKGVVIISYDPLASAGAPSLSSLAQYKSDGTTSLGQGSTTTESTVVFHALVNSSSSNNLLLQVQVSTSTSFANPLSGASIAVASGTYATTTISNIPNGSYYWQARAVDAVTNVVSSGLAFTASGTIAFVVSSTAPTPYPYIATGTMQQYKADASSTLNEGSSTTSNAVFFKALVNASSSNNLQFQVQISTSTYFTNALNGTSTPVAPGNYVMTTIPNIPNGSYYWQARVVDTTTNASSSWTRFGNSDPEDFIVSANQSIPADFVLAVPHVFFDFPTNGTTTLNFANWQLHGDIVTSTESYAMQVAWDDTTGDPMQSSTVMASGTQMLSGVNVSKTVFAGDYTYDGTPVAMNATATLSLGANVIATTTVSFTEQTTVAPLNCGSEDIQCVSYAYDNNGNITRIVDGSATDAARTVDYTYDSLNRLISASSSNAATGGNYHYTYTYDGVGNILSGPAGTYAYNENTASNYANPDAVTSITNGSTTTFTYDNNGNLTNASSGTYTWDYNNRLTTVASSSASSSYAYDYTSQRVTVVNGTSTTYYPETTYSISSSTPTKHIFANGILVASVAGTSTSATVTYINPDHLGGSNVVTDEGGTVVKTLDYYPYGSLRLDEQNGANEQRKYIGQQYDAATALSYLNARYYDGARGQFLSEDPVVLALGNQNQLQQLGIQDNNILLANPQSLNIYSYSGDNPITKSDPRGLQALAGLDDLAIYGIATSPVWAPALYLVLHNALSSAVTSLSTYNVARNPVDPSYPGLPRASDALMQKLGWPTDSSQFMPPRPPKGGDWSKAVKWGAGIGLGTLFLCELTQGCDSPPTAGNSNVNVITNNGSTLYWTQPSSPSNKAIGPADNSGGVSSNVQGLMSWQNPAAKYTFSGGVNIYGEHYNQVFPSK